jgi:hypothetical protein
VGRYDRLGRLQGIEAIERATLLDPNDIPFRLEQLKSLKDGWLDGRGIAPSPAGLDWLAGAIEARYPEDLTSRWTSTWGTSRGIGTPSISTRTGTKPGPSTSAKSRAGTG